MSECTNCGKVEEDPNESFCSRCNELLPQKDLYSGKKKSFVRKVVMPVGLLWIVTGLAFFFFLKAMELSEVGDTSKIEIIEGVTKTEELGKKIEEENTKTVNNNGELVVSKNNEVETINNKEEDQNHQASGEEKEENILGEKEELEKDNEEELDIENKEDSEPSLDEQIDTLQTKYKELALVAKQVNKKELYQKIVAYYKKITEYKKQDLDAAKKEKLIEGYSKIYEKLEIEFMQ